ncbi:hypothetical protein [Agrobacterium pusense]|uniref:Uncharacterized protein n=1 Tax=Agrobacterium pusense TaxID=648995 RepID=A0AA44ENT6_9HYPH|nr:hypothetical protein [Agrobacterium pusense]NRF10918.1 hypothetical protein [Agrobacterium pusense]NRF21628.1 hypothetical protein [Agrobacterium pusense]
MTPHVSKRQKRRTCYDRTRMHWHQARRTQATNPAASAAIQLLGIFGFLFGRMPITTPMPARYVAPSMSPKQAQRIEAARHLGIPTRYLDIVLSTGKVPYGLLFEHIRLGGATRRDALNELRKRMPAEALDWFRHVEKRALWSELSLCFHQGDEEEDTHVRFLQATLAWVERQRKPGERPSSPADADRGFKPNMHGEIVASDDDPHKVRP